MMATEGAGGASALHPDGDSLVIYWSPDWRINSDADQWILQKRGFSERNQTDIWMNKAYFRDLCRAIGYLVQRPNFALPVEIPADPGCELILNLENKFDLWLEGFRRTVLQGDGSLIEVSDIKKVATGTVECDKARRGGKKQQRQVAI